MRFSFFSRALLPALLAASMLASCADESSTIGSNFYKDTVSLNSVTISDSLRFTTVEFNPVTRLTHARNLNLTSPLLFIGRSVDAAAGENTESWGVLQLEAIDLTDVDSAQFVLKIVAGRYGADTNSRLVDLELYTASALTVNDSSTQVARTDLKTKLGSFSASVADTTGTQVTISIDPSHIAELAATSSNSFVLAPTSAMVNVRGFGATEAVASQQPQVILYKKRAGTTDTAIVKHAVIDLHVVMDRSTPDPTQMTLRGGAGVRQLVHLGLSRFDSLKFATINKAELVLYLDPTKTRVMRLSDSTLPLLQVLNANVSDTSFALTTIGVRRGDSVVYSMRNLLQFWLRNPDKNFGLELAEGWQPRSFGGTFIGVEDISVNRWTFWGPTAASSRRPRLNVTYSILR